MYGRGLLIVFAVFGAAFAAPALPECREGAAQPSVRILVTKLERAFETKDAAAMANLTGCPFSVGASESDDLSHVPPAIFAQRFLNEVRVLDLTLKKGGVSSTYSRKPKRIFLWIGEKKRATLFVDREPRVDFRHRHVFSFERDADGWRFTGYATTDGGPLEGLRRGYPNLV